MSAQYKLDKKDLKKWAKNTLIFLAPAIILFLGELQRGADVKEAMSVIYLWGINTAIDLLRKYSTKTK